jgi:hypothetical protein
MSHYTTPAWVALLVVKLPPALLSGSQSRTSPTTTTMWACRGVTNRECNLDIWEMREQGAETDIPAVYIISSEYFVTSVLV